MKKLALALAIATTAISGVGAAAADTPVQFTWPTVTVSTPNFKLPYPNCTLYGYDFTAAPTFTVERRSTYFYDDSGNLVREIRHVEFSGFIHKSTDPSVVIPYAAHFTLIRDVTAGTGTITGLFRISKFDGSGVITISAGRQELVGGAVEDFSGNNAPAEWEQTACAYLAAA